MSTMKGKTAVVLGATGVVGSGVVRRYLDAGATVVGVSRSAAKLDALGRTLGVGADEPFHGVVGSFGDEGAARDTKKAVDGALGGAPVDHVVSVLGFLTMGGAPTATPVETMRTALEDGLVPAFFAAKAFLPPMKDRAGASYTLVSGGLAHFPPPDPSLWLATLKNASLNAFCYGLASETAKSAVRVNTICIHLSVAPIGGDKNQLGMPAEADTLRMGPAFVGVANGTQKGKVICVSSWAEVDALAK